MKYTLHIEVVVDSDAQDAAEVASRAWAKLVDPIHEAWDAVAEVKIQRVDEE